jgi:predicted permease
MRFYRALLHLYPASFRAEYGEDLCAIFALRWEQAGGPFAALLLWAGAILDTLYNAIPAHLDILRGDLAYTARTLRRAPAFAATVVAISALGVGATTAAFTITDHVLLRPLPFPEPDRLVKIWEDHRGQGFRLEPSPANYHDWKSGARSFEAMGAYHEVSLDLSGGGEPERLEGAGVTAGVLPLLGARPAIGRIFTEADDQEGSEQTAILSYGLWQRRYAADVGILGRTIQLDGAPFRVIGVMPADFRFPARTTQFWKAARFGERDYVERDNTYLRVIARLRRGVTIESAQAEMRLVAARIERQWPKENRQVSAAVAGLRDEIGGRSRMLLQALLAAAACVLLIGCANLANLLIARGIGRRRELAVRAAIGAGRHRIVRQLLTESLVLSIAGGGAGVLLAIAALPLLVRLVPNSLPIAAAPAIDLRVLGFALALTVATGIAFAVVPALRACGHGDFSALREGARAGGGRHRLRAALVAVEVAGCVVLLVVSGLLLRAMWRIQSVDPGFRAEGVLTLRTALPMPKYTSTAARWRFYSHVLEGVRRVPGVTGAGYTSFAPMTPHGGIWRVDIAGRDTSGPGNGALMRFVTPGFLDAMRIPVRLGRDISDADTRDRPYVAVVSESFVRRYWPGENPLGRHFQFAFADRVIVGVAADIRARGLERESEPQVYLSCQQVGDGSIIWYHPKDLVVRSGDPVAIAGAVRRAIAAADPEQPVSDVRLLSELVDGDTAPRVVQARVLGGFAAIAFLLAGIGIHGLLLFAVNSRAQEIGVRMALGARRSTILTMVLGDAMKLSAAGVAAGSAVAYVAGRSLEALLAGVDPADAPTYGAAIALCIMVTLAGALAPAMRAVRVDPASVMRAE